MIYQDAPPCAWPSRRTAAIGMGRGVLRQVIAACTSAGWSITSLAADTDVSSLPELLGPDPDAPRLVGVTVELTNAGAQDATGRWAGLDGVRRVDRLDEDE